MNPKTLITQKQEDYELLDSGNLHKLERYGKFVLARPDPQALWNTRLGEDQWRDQADAWFVREGSKGSWEAKKSFPKEWKIEFGNLQFVIRPNLFKHTGLFPEQLSNWEWMKNLVEKRVAKKGSTQPNILNLFGYTGGASLACLQAGAQVTHLDGSKSVIAWVRENAEASKLSDKPLRSICEDALVFVKREIKRGNRYDGILLDPPAFGTGPGGEKWKIEEDFLELLDQLKQVMSDEPLFFLINGYASGYSATAYYNALKPMFEKYGGTFECGELGIEESGKDGRTLPCGIYARWSQKS